MARAKPQKRNSTPPTPPPLPPPPPNRLASVFDDPPRNNVLLLSCMDQRLLDETVWFMNQLNLQNRYDQISLAGAAMGVNHLSSPPLDSTSPAPENTSLWRPIFFHHLKVAIDILYRPIKDVFLMDHLDCGAYKKLHPTKAAEYSDASLMDMDAFHEFELLTLADRVSKFCASQLSAAEAELGAIRRSCAMHEECWKKVEKLAEKRAEAWKDIRVSCFIMDVLGEVKQLGVLHQ